MKIVSVRTLLEATVCCKNFFQVTLNDTNLPTQVQKPYECGMRVKSFAGKSDLKKCIYIHTGKRPYQYDRYCKAVFMKGPLKSSYAFSRRREII
ncbi:hypothetical protein X975_15897, partial [Stegodyphus mimosarum]